LYFSRSSLSGAEREEDALLVGSLDGKVNKRLMPAKGNAGYASGYLIYLREKTLMAQPFDVGKLETVGEAIPIAEPVEYNLDFNRAVFSASQSGILIYQASSTQIGYQLEWFDRAGNSGGKIVEAAGYGGASISPDGKRIAFDVFDCESRNRDIWLYDIARGLKTRFTTDPAVDQFPVWSPDGSRIAFSSDRMGHIDLFQKAISGAGVEEVLFESPEAKVPYDWSSDGKYIAYAELKIKEDVWILPLEGDRKPFVFLQTGFDEDIIQFSPDMHWISYASNESGNWELYVRPFIGADGKPAVGQTRKWQVSMNGVLNCEWNRDGKELFYFSLDKKLMVADIDVNGSTFDVGAVRPLFEVKAKGAAYFYGVLADGQRFLMGIQVVSQSIPPLTLVTNWDAGLKKK
jgi:hypothetical protein